MGLITRCNELSAENPLGAASSALTQVNLRCCACKLDANELAKTRVGKVVELDPKFKLLALDEADLELLWETFKI